MTGLTYNHPKYGLLPLVIHPERPWRVVAYYAGTAVYETDLKAVRPVRRRKNKRSSVTKEKEAEK